MPQPCPSKRDEGTHPEMRIESLPRRPHVVTFDDATLALELTPGAKGKGAVLDGWTDPVGAHDRKVLELEQAMLVEKELVAAFKSCDRVAKNWDVVMGRLNEQPHKLEEYIVLKFEMRSFEKRFARATVSTEKLELQTQWERYCAMEPVYEKILAAKEQFELVRAGRDQAQRDVLAHGKFMSTLKHEEAEAAKKITADHVHACDRDKSLGEIFPSIQTGYIITRLVGTVNLMLEDLQYDEVVAELRAAPRPHTLEFLRYDLRFNRLTLKWETLEEIREQGKYVRDARDERMYFVQECGQGNLDRLQTRLDRGEDVESTDLQGNTGMHLAAAESCIKVMAFLLDNKADKEARNKNMETPLMVATKRGATASVRWLLSVGAKLDVMDRARRTPLMTAILSKSEEMSSLFMEYSVSLRAVDVQWGWTALHCAAHVGMVNVAKELLNKRASPYTTSRTGLTALEVARRARQTDAVSVIEAFFKAEPAHEVITEGGAHVRGNRASNTPWECGMGNIALFEIWQGSHKAAHPMWANDKNFQCVLTIADPRFPDEKLCWLDDDDDIDHLKVEAEVNDEDMSTKPWNQLARHMRAMINFLHKAVRRKQKILVQCTRGKSTSVAFLAVYRLLKHGVGVRHTLSSISNFRGDSIDLSPAMAAGLQQLQESFAREKEKRLAERARVASILSLGF